MHCTAYHITVLQSHNTSIPLDSTPGQFYLRKRSLTQHALSVQVSTTIDIFNPHHYHYVIAQFDLYFLQRPAQPAVDI